jgi:hypothetical protein
LVDDTAEAAIWYERRRAGLGAEFVRSIPACFAIISRQPDQESRPPDLSPVRKAHAWLVLRYHCQVKPPCFTKKVELDSLFL